MAALDGGNSWKAKLAEALEQKNAANHPVNKVERMKNMFNKEDPAPAAAGPAKKWGAVKNVVGTTKASNFVDRIRDAQKKQGGVPGVPKPPQPLGAAGKSPMGNLPAPPGKKIVHDLGWLKRLSEDNTNKEGQEAGKAPKATISIPAPVSSPSVGASEIIQRVNSTGSMESTKSPKGKDEGSEAAGVKGAEEAAVEDPDALPPPPKRLPSAEAKAGGGDDDELPPPPAQKAGDGASPPAAAKKSPADIKRETSRRGMMGHQSMKFSGSVSAMRGLLNAFTRTKSAEPKTGTDDAAEEKTEDRVEGEEFTSLGAHKFQVSSPGTPEVESNWKVTSELGTSPLKPEAIDTIDESEEESPEDVPNRPSFEKRVERMTLKTPGSIAKPIKPAAPPQAAQSAHQRKGGGGCWGGVFGKRGNVPPTWGPERPPMVSIGLQTDIRPAPVGPAQRVSSVTSEDDTASLYGLRSTVGGGEAGFDSPRSGTQQSVCNDLPQSQAEQHSAPPSIPPSIPPSHTPSVHGAHTPPWRGAYGSADHTTPLGQMCDPAAAMGSPSPPSAVPTMVLSDEDVLIDEIRNASWSSSMNGSHGAMLASPAPPPHVPANQFNSLPPLHQNHYASPYGQRPPPESLAVPHGAGGASRVFWNC